MLGAPGCQQRDLWVSYWGQSRSLQREGVSTSTCQEELHGEGWGEVLLPMSCGHGQMIMCGWHVAGPDR